VASSASRLASQRLAVGRVQAAPFAGEHVRIDGVPGQRVAERVATADAVNHEQVDLDRLTQPGVPAMMANPGSPSSGRRSSAASAASAASTPRRPTKTGLCTPLPITSRWQKIAPSRPAAARLYLGELAIHTVSRLFPQKRRSQRGCPS
jgi:hypothetical protein